MSDDLEKTILAELKEIKEYIGERDVVPNAEYCRLRKISTATLKKYFGKPATESTPACPREDYYHVSIKAVDNWRREINSINP
jgi:hypothetical protein